MAKSVLSSVALLFVLAIVSMSTAELVLFTLSLGLIFVTVRLVVVVVYVVCGLSCQREESHHHLVTSIPSHYTTTQQHQTIT